MKVIKIGDLLRERREGKGLLQVDVASQWNISQAMYSKLENNILFPLRSKVTEDIAKFLDMEKGQVLLIISEQREEHYAKA